MIFCNSCLKDKELKDFYKSKSHKTGYVSPCKECIKERERNNYDGDYQKERLNNLSPLKKQKRQEQLTKNARLRRKNPQIRLLESIRTRIYNSLKSYQTTKTDRTIEYLGCSMEDYTRYLEMKFDHKMSWDNYADYWEIDHIKPIDLFNLEIEEELYKAFHYTNTQPLRKVLNRSKSNKIFSYL